MSKRSELPSVNVTPESSERVPKVQEVAERRGDDEAAVHAEKEQRVIGVIKRLRRVAAINHPDWNEVKWDFERWANGEGGYEAGGAYNGFTQEDFSRVLRELESGGDIERPNVQEIDKAFLFAWAECNEKVPSDLSRASLETRRSASDIIDQSAGGIFIDMMAAANPKSVTGSERYKGAFVGWKREDYVVLLEKFNIALEEYSKSIGITPRMLEMPWGVWENVNWRSVESANPRHAEPEEILDAAQDYLKHKQILRNRDQSSPPEYGDMPIYERRRSDAVRYAHWNNEDFERLSSLISEMREREIESTELNDVDSANDEYVAASPTQTDIPDNDDYTLAKGANLQSDKKGKPAQKKGLLERATDWFKGFFGGN